MKDNYKLSKFVSYILRHDPFKYGLEIDRDGWVNIEDLLLVLRSKNKNWDKLCLKDLSDMVSNSNKIRHEIKDNKIRALYGHSIANKIIKEKCEPPEILYHGTSIKSVALIKVEGLRSMNRHYVHLSVDIETAKQVGLRRTNKPIILTIKAKTAYLDGVAFYQGNEQIWLSDNIPSNHIDFDLAGIK